jgi:hypothetical protein
MQKLRLLFNQGVKSVLQAHKVSKIKVDTDVTLCYY